MVGDAEVDGRIQEDRGWPERHVGESEMDLASIQEGDERRVQVDEPRAQGQVDPCIAGGLASRIREADGASDDVGGRLLSPAGAYGRGLVSRVVNTKWP